VRFPVLAIFDAADPGPLRNVSARLDEFDVAVFVSPNAVEKALGAITARRPWPGRVKAAAMGETSARTIARFGVTEIVTPAGRFDSDALLDLPDFQAERISGRKVVIFRGDTGREALADGLRARGAQVEYVACYRRGRPEADPAPLAALLARGELDAITVTSSEGLRNLVEMMGGPVAAQLKATPLFVAHRRIADEALRMGFSKVEITGAGDEGLLAGLIAYFGKKQA
jgi:uroporphyrinogen-III synthase